MRLTLRRRILAVLTFALVWLAAAVPGAEASFPGSNGVIAFVTAFAVDCGTCDPQGQVGWTAVRGGPAARLFAGWRVAFSPRGSWLASSGPALRVARPDGSERRVVGRGSWSVTRPAWSPRGSWLAYIDGGVVVVRADGTGKRLIPNTEGAAQVAWSPAGDRLVFTREAGDDTIETIHVVGLDGSGLRDVARGVDVSWSTQGALAYRREQRLFVNRRGRERVVVRDLDYASDWTDPPAYDWSPHGRQIAYVRGDGTGIYVVDVSGGRPRRVARGYAPRWSPDGRLIAYVPYARGHRIYTVPARGGKSRVFTRVPVYRRCDPRYCADWVNDIDWQPRPRR